MFRFLVRNQYCISDRVYFREYFCTRCMMCLIIIGMKDMFFEHAISNLTIFFSLKISNTYKPNRSGINKGEEGSYFLLKWGTSNWRGISFFTYMYVDRGEGDCFLFKQDRTVSVLGTFMDNFVSCTKWSFDLSTFQWDSFGNYLLSPVVLK